MNLIYFILTPPQIMARNPSTIDTILNMTQPLLCKQSLNAFAVEILTLAINISTFSYSLFAFIYFTHYLVTLTPLTTNSPPTSNPF